MGKHFETLADMVNNTDKYVKNGAVILNYGTLSDGTEPIPYLQKLVNRVEITDIGDIDTIFDGLWEKSKAIRSTFYNREKKQNEPILFEQNIQAMEVLDFACISEKLDAKESYIFTLGFLEMNIRQVMCAELNFMDFGPESTIVMSTAPRLYYCDDPCNMVTHPSKEQQSELALSQYITEIFSGFSQINAFIVYLKNQEQMKTILTNN